MRDRDLDRLFQRFRRQGDVRALGEVFDHAAPELLRIARHLVGSSSEAEDVVQSTFVTAIERASDFDAERRLVPWLIGILVRHAANARRKRAATAELGDVAAPALEVSTLAEERELRSTLRAIVAQLPDTLRNVVASHLIEGKRPQDIALELGLSPGATRVRLHRGLERVRRALPVGFAAGAAAVSVTSSPGLAAMRSEVLACAHDAAPALSASTAASAASIWLGGSLVMQRILLAVAATAVVVGSIWFVGARPSGARSDEPVNAVASALTDVAGAPTEPVSATRDDVVTREAASADPGVGFEGRVVDDVTGAPIAGARVWTTPQDAVERVQRATSSAEGFFEFRAVAAEEPTLLVEADGYAPTRPPLSQAALDDFHAQSQREALDGGARVRLFELRLKRGVAFEGRVVLAADRSPVADADLVLAWKHQGVLVTLSEHTLGRTDALGVMHFDGLLPTIDGAGDGTYVLFAIAEQGLGWTNVARPAGRTALRDIEIAIEAPLELELSVRDESGEAVQGARVHCLPTHEPFAWLMGGQLDEFAPAAPALLSCFSATSDAGGLVRLPRLLRSNTHTSNNASNCRFLVFAEAPGAGTFRAFLQFDCDRPPRVAVTLRRDATTRIRGRVLDRHGQGVEGARIAMQWPPRECFSGAGGAYELAKLPIDPVRVELEASKADMTTARVMVDHAGHGGVLEGQDFVLRAPLAIEGRVVDDRGAPLAGLEVHAFGPGEQRARTPKESPTAADGSFRVEGASEGEWELYPLSSPQPQLADIVWPSDGLRARGGERGVEIVLARREKAHGRLEIDVVDAETGAALDPVYVNVFATPPLTTWVQPRNEPGKVVCENVAPGRYSVWVAVAGRSNGACEVDVSADDAVTRARVEIGAAARVHGRIDWSGMPGALGCDVDAFLMTKSGSVPANTAFARGTAFSASTRLAPGAEFNFDNLTPGPWRIRLNADGVREIELVLDLRSGDEREVVLTPEPAGVIEFIASNSPKRGWVFFEHTDANGAWREARTMWAATLDPMPPMRLTVDPGRVRWRVWFLAEPDMLEKKLTAEMREGELDIAAGQQTRVSLDVVLLD